MYGITQIGKYNVDYEGLSYDGKIPYEMVMLEEFSNDEKPIKGTRKALYFRSGNGYMLPGFKTEEEVAKYMTYKNNCKLAVYMELKVEVIR